MATHQYRLAEELHAVADALDGVEGLAVGAVQLGMSCSSEPELERIAGLLGIEVRTESGREVAQGQFGPVRLVAFADSSASGPTSERAMTMLEVRQARQDQAAESTGATGSRSMKSRPLPPKKELGQAPRLAWAGALSRSAAARRLARGAEGARAAAALVLARDGYSCTCCGASVVGRPHSVRRRSRDGGDTPTNLLTFLGDGSRPGDPADHSERVDSGRDPMDAARGYRLRVGQDPALVPVMVSSQAGGLTLWLTVEGSYRTEPPSP